MGWVKRTFPCDDCGEVVTRKVKTGVGARRVCYSCGERRMLSSVTQLAGKDGEYWDRFRQRNKGRPRKIQSPEQE